MCVECVTEIRTEREDGYEKAQDTNEKGSTWGGQTRKASDLRERGRNYLHKGGEILIVMVMVIGEDGEGRRVEGRYRCGTGGLKCHSLAATCLALIYTLCPCHHLSHTHTHTHSLSLFGSAEEDSSACTGC